MARCGCRQCAQREAHEDVQAFIDTTTEFRNIMWHSFPPDEEYNLRLLADKLQATVTLGDLSAAGSRLRAHEWGEPGERFRYEFDFPPAPHPLEPPEGWCSA